METVDTKSEHHEIDLVIKSPLGVWQHRFQKTTKIQEVLEAAKQHFGFAPNGSYDLRLESNPNEALKSERTLVSYHLKDGDVLVLSDLGVGV